MSDFQAPWRSKGPDQPVARGQAELAYTGKRVFDVAVVALSALLTLPIALVCAVLIKTTSDGPVIFRQERVGLGGTAFTLLKFRTMVHDATPNPVFPTPARVTAVGHWLRRLSFDELPQLINVARREMSIVGPRPALAYQVARYNDRQRGRLAARPGLTGLAQVKGRNGLMWSARIEFDLQYVEHQSALLDAWLVVLTLLTLVRGAPAATDRR